MKPPNHPPFHLREVIEGTPSRIKIVDVGASAPPGHTDIYDCLAQQGLCEIVGFEPSATECSRLNARAPGRRYLPYFVGDGSPARFYSCRAPMTSSLFPPNAALLGNFAYLPELLEVVGEELVETVRLDDIAEASGADFVKLDVQGAELAVIEGADRVLRTTLAVHCEVEFVPLYEKQPLFGDIDRALRQRGFEFHRFVDIQGRSFAPLVDGQRPHVAISQVLWADAVYVRNLFAQQWLERNELLKLALIMHEVYGSFDLAARCLRACDEQAPSATALATRYLERLLEARPSFTLVQVPDR